MKVNNSYGYYVENLKGEYKETFLKIELYCTNLLYNIDKNIREDIISNILDTFVEAQKNNTPINEITGDDILAFCENACSGMKKRDFFREIIRVINVQCWFLLIYSLAMFILEVLSQKSFSQALKSNINIDYLIFVLIFDLLYSPYYLIIFRTLIKNAIKRDDEKKLKRLRIFNIIITIFSLIAMTILIVAIELPISGNILVLIGGSLIEIVVYKIVYNKQITREKQEKIELDEIIYDSTYNESIKNIFYEEFKKTNEKRSKKNKPTFSEEEYIEKQLKNLRNSRKAYYIMYPFFVIFFSVSDFITELKEGTKLINALLGSLGLAVFEIIVLFFVIRWFLKINKKSTEVLTYWKENLKK